MRYITCHTIFLWSEQGQRLAMALAFFRLPHNIFLYPRSLLACIRTRLLEITTNCVRPAAVDIPTVSLFYSHTDQLVDTTQKKSTQIFVCQFHANYRYVGSRQKQIQHKSLLLPSSRGTLCRLLLDLHPLTPALLNVSFLRH